MFCCFWKKTPNSPAYIRKGKSSSVENIMDYGQNLRYDIQSQILQPRYKYYLNYVGNYHRIIQHWTVPGWQQSRHWKIPMPARLPPRNDIVNFKVKLLLNKSGTHKIVIQFCLFLIYLVGVSHKIDNVKYFIDFLKLESCMWVQMTLRQKL